MQLEQNSWAKLQTWMVTKSLFTKSDQSLLLSLTELVAIVEHRDEQI